MKDDKKCREILRFKVAQINKFYSGTIQKKVEKLLDSKFNVPYATACDIFNNVIPFETMSYDLMYKLMVVLKEVISNHTSEIDGSDLNVNKYFTEIEDNLYSKPYESESDNFDIVLKSDEWHRRQMDGFDIVTVYIDAEELVKWRDYNKLRFNPETQRDLIVIETKGVPVMKLDINETSINEIKELLIKNKYFPVPGTININPDYCEGEPFYIRGTSLVIPETSPMDLIEGFHNYTAITQVKDKNPDWNFPVEFKIMTLTKSRANDYIYQMDKKNHFREAQKVKLNSDSKTNYLLDRLNLSSTFHLNGTIDKKTYLFLYNTIEYLFKIGKDIKAAVNTCLKLEENANYVVEKTDHYDKPFTKEEWFIILNLTKYSMQNNLDFNLLLNNINMTSFVNELEPMKDKPKKAQYVQIEDKLKEVVLQNGI